MADDLTKPLLGPGKRGSESGRQRGVSRFGVLLTVLAAVLVGVAIWVMVAAGPGLVEPEGEVRTDLGPDEVVIRVPEAEDNGVVITTPEGFQVDGGGPVIGEPLTGVAISLSPRPESALIETGPYGLLPRIGEDGRRPFDAYARPGGIAAAPQAMVAIVVGGIGINQANTELALARLPAEVSLALAPYGANLATWAARGREAGHELLLQIPLEPFDFPITDPGPHTLIASDPVAANLDRLDWLLAQFTTYVGVVSYAGGRFLAQDAAMAPIVDALAARGLLFVDDGGAVQSRAVEIAAGALPFAAADLVLDQEIGAAAIAARLAELESIALEQGYAIASASAFQVTIEEIEAWAEQAAERGVRLVPISQLASDPQNNAVRIRLD